MLRLDNACHYTETVERVRAQTPLRSAGRKDSSRGELGPFYVAHPTRSIPDFVTAFSAFRNPELRRWALSVGRLFLCRLHFQREHG
jgi:hypothetical protein